MVEIEILYKLFITRNKTALIVGIYNVSFNCNDS